MLLGKEGSLASVSLDFATVIFLLVLRMEASSLVDFCSASGDIEDFIQKYSEHLVGAEKIAVVPDDEDELEVVMRSKGATTAGNGLSFTDEESKEFQEKKKKEGEAASKPFVCKEESCGRQFATAYSLKSHEHVHNGLRPFVCATCGKRFKTSGDMHKHARTHTGERPYSCNECGKAFTTSNILKVIHGQAV